MNIEIEAKFIDIDADEIRLRLKELGATLVQPETLMRRKVYEHPSLKDRDWFRVRDEGDKITMSYKKMADRSLHGTQEIVCTVSDFDGACEILEAAYLRFVSYQETKRETWRLDGADVTIDTWPWIPTFLEIEALSEDSVQKAVISLGLDMANATYGSVENVYAMYYDVTEKEVCDWSEILFTPVPEWLASCEKSDYLGKKKSEAILKELLG
jgi:adenylate cyclase class 2